MHAATLISYRSPAGIVQKCIALRGRRNTNTKQLNHKGSHQQVKATGALAPRDGFDHVQLTPTLTFLHLYVRQQRTGWSGAGCCVYMYLKALIHELARDCHYTAADVRTCMDQTTLSTPSTR